MKHMEYIKYMKKIVKYCDTHFYKLLFLLLLFIFLYVFFSNKSQSFESFTDGNAMEEYSDTYDMNYVKLYDQVFDYKPIYQSDVKNITSTFATPLPADFTILDVGTGSGKHYQFFSKWIEELKKKQNENKENENNIVLKGVDKSDSFLKIAKLRNPDGEFILGNVTNAELYPAHSFDVILCMYDTIHHNTKEEQEKIFENFYYWLKPTGSLYIHLFNPNQLDPAPREFSQYYYDDNKKRHSQTYFDHFVHDAYWMKKEDKSDEYEYIEQFIIPESGKRKTKVHTFTIPNRDWILDRLKYYGFKGTDVMDMKKIKAANMDLFIFTKKSQ
jgi:ubiquinone/menaquinone biosynthesis C-methylase UbiE